MKEIYTMDILQIMLGKEKAEELLTKITRDSSEIISSIDNLEKVIDAYSITILLIGFCKKPVEIDKCNVKLKNEKNLEMDTGKIVDNYKEYIELIEKSKFELLRKIV